jgi:hypothetical protein
MFEDIDPSRISLKHFDHLAKCLRESLTQLSIGVGLQADKRSGKERRVNGVGRHADASTFDARSGKDRRFSGCSGINRG